MPSPLVPWSGLTHRPLSLSLVLCVCLHVRVRCVDVCVRAATAGHGRSGGGGGMPDHDQLVRGLVLLKELLPPGPAKRRRLPEDADGGPWWEPARAALRWTAKIRSASCDRLLGALIIFIY